MEKCSELNTIGVRKTKVSATLESENESIYHIGVRKTKVSTTLESENESIYHIYDDEIVVSRAPL